MHMIATFSNPVFDAQGRLSAQAECYNKPEVRWPITLDDKGGKWRWTPLKKCSVD